MNMDSYLNYWRSSLTYPYFSGPSVPPGAHTKCTTINLLLANPTHTWADWCLKVPKYVSRCHTNRKMTMVGLSAHPSMTMIEVYLQVLMYHGSCLSHESNVTRPHFTKYQCHPLQGITDISAVTCFQIIVTVGTIHQLLHTQIRDRSVRLESVDALNNLCHSKCPIT